MSKSVDVITFLTQLRKLNEYKYLRLKKTSYTGRTKKDNEIQELLGMRTDASVNVELKTKQNANYIFSQSKMLMMLLSESWFCVICGKGSHFPSSLDSLLFDFVHLFFVPVSPSRSVCLSSLISHSSFPFYPSFHFNMWAISSNVGHVSLQNFTVLSTCGHFSKTHTQYIFDFRFPPTLSHLQQQWTLIPVRTLPFVKWKKCVGEFDFGFNNAGTYLCLAGVECQVVLIGSLSSHQT